MLGRHIKALIAAAALAAVTGAGCSSSRPSQTEGKENADEVLRRYEADFRPSDYDPEPGARLFAPRDSIPTEQSVAPDVPATSASETVPGFRVQILSTPNIDEARRKKEEIARTFPEEWFVVEYDPPSYKIRCGNFLSRLEADRFARILGERGYPGAWVVPDRVLKNPPPHPNPQGEDPSK